MALCATGMMFDEAHGSCSDVFAEDEAGKRNDAPLTAGDTLVTNPALRSKVSNDNTVAAQVIDHERAENGSHTVYKIRVNLMLNGDSEQVASSWIVKRRYNHFHRLHGVLKQSGFPCPELPPKQLLWATFNQESFLKQRMAALNIWLQGTLCIWQSIPMSDHEVSFTISELLEEFLCDDDTVDEARLRGLSSPFAQKDSTPESEDASLKTRTGATAPSPSGGSERSAPPQSTRGDGGCEKQAAKEALKRLHELGRGVGVEISHDPSTKGPDQRFTMYSEDGNTIQQSFRPFTSTVKFTPKCSVPGANALSCVENGPDDDGDPRYLSCTPVSVPPTPHGQHEFLHSWSMYTETVLAYVAERLASSEDGPVRPDLLESDSDGDSCEDSLPSQCTEFKVRNGPHHAFVFGGQCPDALGPNKVDAHGLKLIDRLLSEVSSSIDFVGTRWQLLGEKKKVVFFKRVKRKAADSVAVPLTEKISLAPCTGTSEVHCFLGRGVIDCSAREIFELVRKPTSRHLYDRMVRVGSERVIESLQGPMDPAALQLTFETRQRLTFLCHSRDCCVLQYSTQLEDGRYIVASTSVQHEDCSIADERTTIRAILPLCGWVLEPVSESSCKATYTIQIDFSGNVPSKFLTTMAFRQPLCIRYAESYLHQERSGAPSSL